MKGVDVPVVDSHTKSLQWTDKSQLLSICCQSAVKIAHESVKWGRHGCALGSNFSRQWAIRDQAPRKGGIFRY